MYILLKSLLITFIIFKTLNLNAGEVERLRIPEENKWDFNSKLKFADEKTLFTYARFVLSRKIKLFQSNDELFQKNYLSFGHIIEMGNNYIKTGPIVSFSPVIFFDLKVKYNFYYGWKILVFNSVTDPIFKNNLDAAEGNKIKSIGHSIIITPELKFKFGNLIILNETDIYYMSLRKAQVFYNDVYDHLQSSGFNISNVISIGGIINKNLIIALSNIYIRAFQSKYDKLGLTIIFYIYDFKFISNKDYIKIALGYWVKDKYRFNDDGTLKGFIASLIYEAKIEF